MRGFREIFQKGIWKYGIVVDRDAENDGTWDWRAIRVPISGIDHEVLGLGKADAEDEALRLAEVSLQVNQELERHAQ